MALTGIQRDICRVIAAARIASGETYVAGGATLNEWLGATRVSRDLDLFHDTAEALQASWEADRKLLSAQGFSVAVIRQNPYFVEAAVRHGGEETVLEWAQDSAFRFFPLVEHPELGLTLHPFDLATNKTLALVGRLEVRDWVDLMAAADGLQPLGYLAWAACGKDPGYGPEMLLCQAARAHYSSAVEVSRLTYEGTPPDAAQLSLRWKQMLPEAKEIVDRLPGEHVGYCVLNADLTLCTSSPEELPERLATDQVRFHSGSVRGALPRPT